MKRLVVGFVLGLFVAAPVANATESVQVHFHKLRKSVYCYYTQGVWVECFENPCER